jgi:serine protease Do
MIRVVGEMLRARRRQSNYDGVVLKDRIDQTPDGAARTVIVDRVEPSSPAATAGLRKGDELVRVGDVQVACSFDLERALLDCHQGEHVPVVVRRQSAEQRLDLVLQPANRTRPATGDLVWRKLGVRLAPIDGDLVSRVNHQLHGGLEVTTVDAEGAAGRAGIRRGDILVGLHQWETLTLDNVVYVLSHPDLSSFNPLSFHIVRGGQIRRGWIQQVD